MTQDPYIPTHYRLKTGRPRVLYHSYFYVFVGQQKKIHENLFASPRDTVPSRFVGQRLRGNRLSSKKKKLSVKRFLV